VARYILTKEEIKDLLIKANKERYSDKTQADMNKVNHSDWFAYVTDQMHRRLLKESGYSDRLEDVLDELYSCRWRFRDDPEMNEFFKTLVHVQMDLTADGPLRPGDDAVNAPLYTLEGVETDFNHFLEESKNSNKPLVVFAGSWT
jgi:hypothetical protein